MIESIMYLGIGFLVAALGLLAVVPLVHGRAVRLTKRRHDSEFPLTAAENLVAKDLLRAEFAMATRRLEMSIEQLNARNVGQLVELGRKINAISQLEIERNALRRKLRATEGALAVKSDAVQEAERVLSVKESELTRLTSDLDERSTQANAQKIEIVALKTRIETLKESLDRVSNELKTTEGRRDAELLEYKAATEKLMDERGKFEKFHRRAAELIQRLVVRTTEDRSLGRRAQDDLESRLAEQSQLLNERELELEHLRSEIEITRKAEADLRIAMIEIDGCANAAVQNLEAEKVKLRAVLDRANGECARLSYELNTMKQRVKEHLVA